MGIEQIPPTVRHYPWKHLVSLKYWLGRSWILLPSINKHRRGTELCINIANNLSHSLIRQRNWIQHISCILCMCGLHAITWAKWHISYSRRKSVRCKILARLLMWCSKLLNLYFKLQTKYKIYFITFDWIK